MRILIVTMTTLATTGALASTFADDAVGVGPRVSDLEVFEDGVTFVAAGSVTGVSEEAGTLPVLVKARSVVKGECLGPDAGAAPRRFAVPLVLAGAATTRRVGRDERSFFARTDPPGVSSAEVCPSSEWAVTIRDVVFIGAKLQIGRGPARLVCQFPAVDGPVAEPGCHLQR